ncbi:hypothetical protein ACWF82_07285 [Nocardia sp. NPDC055053]
MIILVFIAAAVVSITYSSRSSHALVTTTASSESVRRLARSAQQTADSAQAEYDEY